jgi:hypothetical protein
LASCRKFCPSDFVGRTPNRADNERMSAGPSKVTR